MFYIGQALFIACPFFAAEAGQSPGLPEALTTACCTGMFHSSGDYLFFVISSYSTLYFFRIHFFIL